MAFVAEENDPSFVWEKPNTFAEFWGSGAEDGDSRTFGEPFGLGDQLINDAIRSGGAPVRAGNVEGDVLKITFGLPRYGELLASVHKAFLAESFTNRVFCVLGIKWADTSCSKIFIGLP